MLAHLSLKGAVVNHRAVVLETEHNARGAHVTHHSAHQRLVGSTYRWLNLDRVRNLLQIGQAHYRHIPAFLPLVVSGARKSANSLTPNLFAMDDIHPALCLANEIYLDIYTSTSVPTHVTILSRPCRITSQPRGYQVMDLPGHPTTLQSLATIAAVCSAKFGYGVTDILSGCAIFQVTEPVVGFVAISVVDLQS